MWVEIIHEKEVELQNWKVTTCFDSGEINQREVCLINLLIYEKKRRTFSRHLHERNTRITVIKGKNLKTCSNVKRFHNSFIFLTIKGFSSTAVFIRASFAREIYDTNRWHKTETNIFERSNTKISDDFNVKGCLLFLLWPFSQQEFLLEGTRIEGETEGWSCRSSTIRCGVFFRWIPAKVNVGSLPFFGAK